MIQHFSSPNPSSVVPAIGGPLVHLHLGKAVTNSLTIATEFQRSHKNVLQSLDSLIADGTINRLDFKPVKFVDAKGEERRMIELTERGALIAMPFIGGRNSRAGQVRLVDAFLKIRDELNQDGGNWSDTRRQASTGYLMMSDALCEARADDGKRTMPYHYANEAKLVNWVLFGQFAGVNRNDLPLTELKLLEKVEARNAIWIARGRTYAERKSALVTFAAALRVKRERIAS